MMKRELARRLRKKAETFGNCAPVMILEVLSAKSKPMRVNDIHLALPDISAMTIRGALTRMVKDGRVKKCERGEYAAH
jgi:DNA-binding HxlR family transcriptional regulator